MDFAKRLDVSDWEFRLVFGRTRIDYDESKEDKNRRQHKYSLESAVYLLEQVMWLPFIKSRPFMTSDAFRENDEVRHMHITVDDTKTIVHMVTTMRPDETVRVISLRRASEKEIRTFVELTGYSFE